MATYKETKLIVRATEAIDAMSLGTTYPIHVADSQGRTLLILHYANQASADGCADALARLSECLVGLTSAPT